MSSTDDSPGGDFPPQTIQAFLAWCAGDWLTLRSQLSLSDGSTDSWHRSQRGELKVAYLEPQCEGEPGGLRITPPAEVAGGSPGDAAALCRTLIFLSEGRFHCPGDRGDDSQGGSWRLWPDGSLELSVSNDHAVVRERIWFTKPNLRLRSSVEHSADGRPGRASFSSEIRRVGRSVP